MLSVEDLKTVFLEKLERTKSMDEAFTKAVWIAYTEGIKAGERKMSKFYIEAYYADGTPLLGNLDGQGVIYAKRYKRTIQYKELLNRKFSERIAYHQIICANTRKVVETIPNKRAR